MSKKDDFATLIGSAKTIETDPVSPDFYRPKPTVSLNKKQLAESFEHSPISQSDYNIGIEDIIEYQRSGVQNSLFKQLSKGELTVYESIDLHGMTTLEAEVYISTTIENQRYYHMSCLRIVHGKGYHAGDTPYDKPAPKLKNFTARYLSEHQRVLAYASCPKNRGGTGAVYVLLRSWDGEV